MEKPASDDAIVMPKNEFLAQELERIAISIKEPEAQIFRDHAMKLRTFPDDGIKSQGQAYLKCGE